MTKGKPSGKSIIPHVSAKGCVVRDGCLLLAQYQDVGEVGHHYNLPGGKVLGNEDLRRACKRKVQWETGALVEPRELLFVYEYIGANHDYWAGDKHSVSLIFRCDLLPGSEPSLAACLRPDDIQTDVCWVPIEKLHEVDLLPRIQTRLQAALLRGEGLVDRYWGDVL